VVEGLDYPLTEPGRFRKGYNEVGDPYHGGTFLPPPHRHDIRAL
jgi:hypothetical protein